MPRRGSNFGVVSKAGKLFASSSDAYVDADGVMSYGLTAATQRKMDAKFDTERAAQLQAWIEEVTKKPWPEASFGAALKDGKLLVRLSNKCKKLGAPGIKKIKANTSKLGFKQMENISNFLKSCRALGMSEQELFCTPDLYEAKNLALVVDGLFAFASHVQAKTPDYAGPRLGAGASHAGGKKFVGKSYSGATKLSMGSRGIQEKVSMSTGSRDIGFGADNGGASAHAGATKLSMGSRGIQEKVSMCTGSRDIGFGADSGGSSAGGVSQLSMGSRGIQEDVSIDRSRDIGFGADASGGSAGGVSQLSMGSRGIQEDAGIDRSRDIGFGADAGGDSAGGVSQLSMGSRGVMEEAGVDRSRDIGFGADAGDS